MNLVRNMPQMQDRSFDLLTCSPAFCQCATAVSLHQNPLSLYLLPEPWKLHFRRGVLEYQHQRDFGMINAHQSHLLQWIKDPIVIHDTAIVLSCSSYCYHICIFLFCIFHTKVTSELLEINRYRNHEQ